MTPVFNMMPEDAQTRRKPIQLLILFIGSGLVTAAFLFFLWQSNPDTEFWKDIFKNCYLFLENNPWALILAVATLPGIGFPASPILVLFGVVLGPRYGIINASILAVAALGFCSTWSYVLSAGPLRGVLKKFIFKKRELPALTKENAYRIGFILRITPGIPYALQNVSLGVIGLDFKTFLIVSLPIQSLYAVGFVVTGGAIFQGQTGLAITGFLLLVVAILVVRMLTSSSSKINVG
ncbi:MAG: VTT domain-containing protein [Verrucomicrobiota bacterium]